MRKLWNRLVSDESGQGLVEYILIVAVIALGIILALVFFRNTLGNSYNNVSNNVAAQPS